MTWHSTNTPTKKVVCSFELAVKTRKLGRQQYGVFTLGKACDQ
jgi:hypothetical protein